MSKPKNNGKRWDDTDKATLKYDYSKGIPVNKIARELGRTQDAIRDEASRLGIKYKKNK